MTPEPPVPPPLGDVLAARARQLDAGRPDAVEAQHRRGALTARERIERLVEPGSFLEYGMLARPAHQDLDGPADGIVVGVGSMRGRPLAVIAYDSTVHAGTQGHVSHLKNPLGPTGGRGEGGGRGNRNDSLPSGGRGPG